ncbi:MAG TPA: FHA domain-containing protein [Anaerolineae bacterium]|jgi:pSer/pThr/pTyr-binding forkhead associated (FHA) protein|nr:FHA domain-containing protein [Anaerolineae bacterium]
MQCKKCGSRIEKEDEYCRKCGELLASDVETTITLSPFETEEESGEIEVSAIEEPVLIVKKGPYVGHRFTLTKEKVTLGRDPASDIFLDDITVSRHHARIEVLGDTVNITDVGSLNGTYVNQERIETARPLKSNDELQIGKFRLVFLSKEARE